MSGDNLSSSPPVSGLKSAMEEQTMKRKPVSGVMTRDTYPVLDEPALGPLQDILKNIWQSANHPALPSFTESYLLKASVTDIEKEVISSPVPLASPITQLRSLVSVKVSDGLGLLALEHPYVVPMMIEMANNCSVRSLRFAALGVIVRTAYAIQDLEIRGAHTFGSDRARDILSDLIVAVVIRAADVDSCARLLVARTLGKFCELIETGEIQAALNVLLCDENEHVRAAAIVAGATHRQRIESIARLDHGSVARKSALNFIRLNPPKLIETISYLTESVDEYIATREAAARLVWLAAASYSENLGDAIIVIAQSVHPCTEEIGSALVHTRPAAWSLVLTILASTPRQDALVGLVVAMAHKVEPKLVVDALDLLVPYHPHSIGVLGLLSHVEPNVEAVERIMPYFSILCTRAVEDRKFVFLLRDVLDIWQERASESWWDRLAPELQRVSGASALGAAAVAGLVEIELSVDRPLFISCVSRRLQRLVDSLAAGTIESADDLERIAALVHMISENFSAADDVELEPALNSLGQLYFVLLTRHPRQRPRPMSATQFISRLQRGEPTNKIVHYVTCLERWNAFDEPVSKVFEGHPLLAQRFLDRPYA